MLLPAPLAALLALVLPARAQEHAPPAVGAVAVLAAEIPDGSPTEVAATEGDDLQAIVRGLTRGSILHVRAGTYAAPLHIDRPLTIEADPGAILAGDGHGTLLIIGADDVTVRGLAIRGGGTNATTGDAGVLVHGERFRLERLLVEDALIGLDLRQANHGVITGCTVRGKTDLPLGQRGDGIRLWEAYHNLIEDNELEGTRDLVVWYSSHNRILHNRVHDGRYGTHFMHTEDNEVVGNAYDNNVVGIFVMYSEGIHIRGNRVTGARGAAGVGLGFKESDAIDVTGNWLVGNTTGIYLDNTPHRIGGSTRFVGNLYAYNHTGLRIHGSNAGATFTGNDFHENGVPVAVDGNVDAHGSHFAGNWWSEYAGYDLDGDGTGDLPFAWRAVTTGLASRYPEISFFSGTPAAALLDLLGAAFPMFAPKALMQDDTPRMGTSPYRVPEGRVPVTRVPFNPPAVGDGSI